MSSNKSVKHSGWRSSHTSKLICCTGQHNFIGPFYQYLLTVYYAPGSRMLRILLTRMWLHLTMHTYLFISHLICIYSLSQIWTMLGKTLQIFLCVCVSVFTRRRNLWTGRPIYKIFFNFMLPVSCLTDHHLQLS